jgi:fructose-1,6-bisphosphatase/inositol monophosphatase family enzyme
VFEELWSDLVGALLPILQDHRSRLGALRVDEKPDHTLLTEADVLVEQTIIEHINAADPGMQIVAEESGLQRRTDLRSIGKRTWVIDPIDGTAEFVQPDRFEYCSVICVLEQGVPTNAIVIAPELGKNRTPLIVTADRSKRTVLVGSTSVSGIVGRQRNNRFSVTRSATASARQFERKLIESGAELKTRTTSQTIDMIRTAVDLARHTEDRLEPFDCFYRQDQKIWDGLAGMCIGETLGLSIVTVDGGPRLPVDGQLLEMNEPTFDSTIMGLPEAVEWFLSLQPQR